METKHIFQVFAAKDAAAKEDAKGYLVAWLSGEDVPVYARGSLYLSAFALRDLLAQAENGGDDGIVLRKKAPVIVGRYDSDDDAVRVLIAKNNKEMIETEADAHPEIMFNLSADVLTAASYLAGATRENYEEFSKLTPIGSGGAPATKIAGLFAKKSRSADQSGMKNEAKN